MVSTLQIKILRVRVDCSVTKCETKMPGVSQPENSSPEERHGTPGTVLLWLTQETEWPGQGR